MLNKKFFIFLSIFAFVASQAFANDAVFSQDKSIEEINLKPATIEAPQPVQNEINAINTKTSAETLSTEKFKSAASNLESAQVDVREQLGTYKTLVEQKQSEVDIKKAELSKLKKQYKALQKKMKNIEKMKKMLNTNIQN